MVFLSPFYSQRRRQRVADFVLRIAPDNAEVVIGPERMTSSKKRRFHAVCGELAKTGVIWGGRSRSRAEWKVLLISGHAVATGLPAEVVQGLEGELIDIREATSQMSRQRGQSLITYAEAFAVRNGVLLKDIRHYED